MTDKTPEEIQAEETAQLAAQDQGRPETFVDELEGPSAADRLRAFEDEHLGPDAIRIHGRVERGFGSKFKNLPPEKHRHYAALERLVEAEQKVAEAAAAHLAAQAEHAEALKEVEAASGSEQHA